ncbi:MAG: hypothetical protein ACRDJW_13340 [Thermomicrobiales bacterium]
MIKGRELSLLPVALSWDRTAWARRYTRAVAADLRISGMIVAAAPTCMHASTTFD